MRRIAFLMMISVFATVGCASHDGPSVLTFGAPKTRNAGGISVAADPYVEPERQAAFFSADFSGQGVFAAHLTIRNDGTEPVQLRASEIKLVTADGTVLFTERGSTIVSVVGVNPDVAGTVAVGVFAGILLGGPAAAANAVAGHRAEVERLTKLRTAEYNEMQLKDAMVGPGKSVSGFVYFSGTTRELPLENSAIYLRVAGASDGQNAFLALPLGASEGGSAGQIQLAAEPATSVEPPSRSIGKIRAYLNRQTDQLRNGLSAYNRENRLLVEAQGGESRVKLVNSIELVEAYGKTVWLEIAFAVGSKDDQKTGTYLFKLAWQGGRLAFIGHQSPKAPREKPPAVAPAEPAPAAIFVQDLAAGTGATAAAEPGPVATGEPPLYAEWQVRGYLNHHKGRFRDGLTDYNKKHRLVTDPQRASSGINNITKPKVKRIHGKTVALEVGFEVGRGSEVQSGTFVFDLEWRNDHLEFVSHWTVEAWRKEAPLVE